MRRKQLIALFICNIAPYIGGTALMTLLPVYVSRLGADPVSPASIWRCRLRWWR